MRDVMVVGAAQTAFGISAERRLRDLAREAADAALVDAQVEPGEIDLVVFGNAAAGLLNGQEMIRARVSLGESRVAERPMVTVENACASASSAFHLAWRTLGAGGFNAVLVVGAEKMSGQDRSLVPRALATALDVEADGGSRGQHPFMDLYAKEAHDYMQRSGATPRDFALVAAKNSFNGSLNRAAQHRTPISVEAALEARMIVPPLTRPMCSSIADGAAALVLVSAAFGRQRGLSGPRVLASELESAAASNDIVERAGRAAFERAGVGPSDLSLVEVHDAAAPAELVIAEQLGLVPEGDGPRLVREELSSLGGRCPINPSGGLLARGHPIGATGAAQLVELVDQLRGRAGRRQVDGASLALAENAGGWVGAGPAVCAVTIMCA